MLNDDGDTHCDFPTKLHGGKVEKEGGMKTGDDAGLETDVRVIFALGLKVHLLTNVR